MFFLLSNNYLLKDITEKIVSDYFLYKVVDRSEITSLKFKVKKISDICDCSNKYIYQIINVENQRLKYIFKNREHLYK